MNDQVEVLKGVAERLERAGIAYMISGSTAMNFYAQPRMTRDIDIVVELRPEDCPRLVSIFSPDFYIDEETVRDAVAAESLFNAIHTELVVKVDFIVRKNTPYRREEFDRRRRVKLGEMELWLVSIEDLLLSKLAWARDSHSELQLRDIRNLIASVVELDWNYVEYWASELTVKTLLDEIRR